MAKRAAEVRFVPHLPKSLGPCLLLTILFSSAQLTSAWVLSGPWTWSHRGLASSARVKPIGSFPLLQPAIQAQRLPAKVLATQASAVLEPKDSLGLSVAVIGGGPAGLASALIMSKLECVNKVMVLEKQTLDSIQNPQATADEHGITLHNRTKTYMISALGDEVWSNCMQEGFANASGRLFDNLAIMRGGIQRSILKEMRGDKLDLRFGATQFDIDTLDRSLHIPGQETFYYDLLIAADGVNSETRAKVGGQDLEPHKTSVRTRFKTLQIPASTDPEGVLRGKRAFCKVDDCTVWFFPKKQGGHAVLFMWDLFQGYNPGGITSCEEFRNCLQTIEITSLGPGWDSTVHPREYLARVADGDLESFLSKKPKHFWVSKCPRLYDENKHFALVGDAAHQFTATLGQGVPCGFLGAMTLADFVAKGMKQQSDPSFSAEAKHDAIRKALRDYGKVHKAESRALTDLNLVALEWFTPGKEGTIFEFITNEIQSDASTSYRSIRNRIWPWVLYAKLKWRFMSVSERVALETHQGFKLS